MLLIEQKNIAGSIPYQLSSLARLNKTDRQFKVLTKKAEGFLNFREGHGGREDVLCHSVTANTRFAAANAVQTDNIFVICLFQERISSSFG